MEIKRNCVMCGKSLMIHINENGTYNKGYYFGKIKVPVGEGKYIKVGTTKLFGKIIDVVKWNGKEKKVEYWECNKCVNEK